MEEKKDEQLLENYSGIISNHFEFFAKWINEWCARKNIKIPREAWILTTTFLFLIIDFFFPGSLVWLGISTFTLIVLNIMYTNSRTIRLKFFKTPEQKLRTILEKNNQDALIELENYIKNKAKISSSELDMLFSERLKENYSAYYMVLRNTKLSEPEIEWFLEKKVMLEPFVDEAIIKEFIESCRINISHKTFMSLKQQLLLKNTSVSLIKMFNYKFVQYTKASSILKKVIKFNEKEINDFKKGLKGISAVMLFGCYLFGAIITVIKLQKGDNSTEHLGILLTIALIFPILLVITAIVQVITRKLAKRRTNNTLT